MVDISLDIVDFGDDTAALSRGRSESEILVTNQKNMCIMCADEENSGNYRQVCSTDGDKELDRYSKNKTAVASMGGYILCCSEQKKRRATKREISLYRVNGDRIAADSKSEFTGDLSEIYFAENCNMWILLTRNGDIYTASEDNIENLKPVTIKYKKSKKRGDKSPDAGAYIILSSSLDTSGSKNSLTLLMESGARLYLRILEIESNGSIHELRTELIENSNEDLLENMEDSEQIASKIDLIDGSYVLSVLFANGSIVSISIPYLEENTSEDGNTEQILCRKSDLVSKYGNKVIICRVSEVLLAMLFIDANDFCLYDLKNGCLRSHISLGEGKVDNHEFDRYRMGSMYVFEKGSSLLMINSGRVISAYLDDITECANLAELLRVAGEKRDEGGSVAEVLTFQNSEDYLEDKDEYELIRGYSNIEVRKESNPETFVNQKSRRTEKIIDVNEVWFNSSMFIDYFVENCISNELFKYLSEKVEEHGLNISSFTHHSDRIHDLLQKSQFELVTSLFSGEIDIENAYDVIISLLPMKKELLEDLAAEISSSNKYTQDETNDPLKIISLRLLSNSVGMVNNDMFRKLRELPSEDIERLFDVLVSCILNGTGAMEPQIDLLGALIDTHFPRFVMSFGKWAKSVSLVEQSVKSELRLLKKVLPLKEILFAAETKANRLKRREVWNKIDPESEYVIETIDI